MSDTVNVLPHLQELKDSWKRQDFRFTNQQQEEYNLLMQARRERVAEFYATGRVQVGPKVNKQKLEEDDSTF